MKKRKAREDFVFAGFLVLLTSFSGRLIFFVRIVKRNNDCTFTAKTKYASSFSEPCIAARFKIFAVAIPELNFKSQVGRALERITRSNRSGDPTAPALRMDIYLAKLGRRAGSEI